MAKNDPITSAMEDVTSVAEELHKLHLQVKQYESSSKRMSDISNVLIDLSKSVKQMEGKFSIALSSTEAIQESVAALLNSVPDVINRIEASDAARSISEFSNALTETKGLIESNKIIVESLKTSITNEREQHGKTIKEIGDKTERLAKALGQQSQLLQLTNQVLTQNVVTSVTDNAIAIAEIKSLIDGAVAKSTEAVSTQASTLASVHALQIHEFRKLAEGNQLNANSISDGFVLVNSTIDKRSRFIVYLLVIIVGLEAFILFRNFI